MEEQKKKFVKIYEEYSDKIFRYFFYRMKDRDQALDLTQSVFSNFWKYMSSGKEVEYPKSFLFRSAHNLFVNTIRDNKRDSSLDDLSEKGFDVPYDDEDKIEVERQKEIIESLAAVDELYKEVLVLRYVNGLKVKEIAEMLGESQNNVSVKIYRGLKKLKEIHEQDREKN